jgi:hypothetical protein
VSLKPEPSDDAQPSSSSSAQDVVKVSRSMRSLSDGDIKTATAHPNREWVHEYKAREEPPALPRPSLLTVHLCPYVSFVSRQLHQYLLALDADAPETVAASVQEAAVLFCDASGFTALTERLAALPNGAEKLTVILNRFFTNMLDIISAYGGDAVKVRRGSGVV